MLATNEFVSLAKAQARSMGYPDLRLVIVKHPLGGVPEEKALEKSAEAVEQIAEIFKA